ncbi:MAG: serine/threonine-protein kinase [Gemmataceae bacterium]
MNVDPEKTAGEPADLPPTLSVGAEAPDTCGEPEHHPTPKQPAPPALGNFGDYELLAELARGGMGVVFRARQISLDRVVALKMILSGELASDMEIQRFRTEAEAAARLDHPNIVPIYEVGEQEGRHYFTMKFVEGGSLAQHLEKFRKPDEAAELVALIAHAVHHAHQRGILHRDLKPANILLTPDGQPQVTDFGLAKRLEQDSAQTHTGAILGTPSYMAPEQAAGKKDAATVLADIYSLGAILYELLTGVVPFRGESAWETVKQVQEQPPVPPSTRVPGLDRTLEAICLKCLEKDPRRRYDTAEALALDLEHWQSGEATAARPPSAAQLLWIWVRRNIGITAWVLLIGVVCGGLGTGLIAIQSVWDLLISVDDTYEKFPSLKSPWLAVDWELPDGAIRALTIAGMVLFALPGLLVVMVARPKDAWSALGIGLATGLFAGIASFAFGVGWATLLMHVEESSAPDIELLGQEIDVAASNGKQPTDLLVEKYPDLKNVPAAGRGKLLSAKIRADIFTRSLAGIWLGMLCSVVGAGGVAVAQTLAASALLRQREHVAGIVVPYLEVGIAYAWAFYSVIFMLFDAWLTESPGLRLELTLAGFLMLPVLIQIAVVQVPWPLRIVVYVVLLVYLYREKAPGVMPAPATFAMAGMVAILVGHLAAAAWSRWKSHVAKP